MTILINNIFGKIMSKDNSINFGKIKFPRNGVLASGILGDTGWSMAKVAESGAGGVTSKSISKEERKGHSTPVIQLFKAGMIKGHMIIAMSNQRS